MEIRASPKFVQRRNTIRVMTIGERKSCHILWSTKPRSELKTWNSFHDVNQALDQKAPRAISAHSFDISAIIWCQSTSQPSVCVRRVFVSSKTAFPKQPFYEAESSNEAYNFTCYDMVIPDM